MTASRPPFYKMLYTDRTVVYEYIDLLSVVGLLISAVGIGLAIFKTEPGSTVNWCGTAIAISLICVSILTYRLSYRYREVASVLKYKEIQLERFNSEKQEALDSLNSKIEDLSQIIKRTQDDSFEISARVHSIIHETRTLQGHFLDAINDYINHGTIKSAQNIVDLKFNNYLNLLLQNLQDLYGRLSGKQCAITIKAIDENSKVSTIHRDGVSIRQRSAVDKKMQSFRFEENTAFYRIMASHYDNDYYATDNLTKEVDYKNKNKDWQKLYNACVVVPIRKFLGGEEVGRLKYDVFGFLCVDNLGGGLNNPLSIEICSLIGDNLYCIFVTYGLVSNLFGKCKEVSE